MRHQSYPTQHQQDVIINLIAYAAGRGERCPTFKDFKENGIRDNVLPMMAREGVIRIEVSGHNFRTVWICKGPFLGRHTAYPPKHYSEPHKVIGPERPVLAS